MTAKVYVDVLAVFSREGELIPKAFVWEDGRRYEIDKISKPERCASRKAGGMLREIDLRRHLFCGGFSFLKFKASGCARKGMAFFYAQKQVADMVDMRNRPG